MPKGTPQGIKKIYFPQSITNQRGSFPENPGKLSPKKPRKTSRILLGAREAIIKKSSLKSQLVMRLNGDWKLHLNGYKKDQNTKFFHSFANTRNLTNRISALNINGYYCQGPTKIEEEIIQFFKDVIGGLRLGFPAGPANLWLIKQAAQLESPFSVEEIKQAVFSMAPDGFTMAFFQECWDMVQLDLVDFFHEFHMNGRYQEALMRPSLPLS